MSHPASRFLRYRQATPYMGHDHIDSTSSCAV
jgi:hypothetical protein